MHVQLLTKGRISGINSYVLKIRLKSDGTDPEALTTH